MAKIYVCLLLLLGCSSVLKKELKPTVMVTIPPYAFFVNAIAQGSVSTEIFIPPGANPHTYEPTPQQVERFAKARVWFCLGDPVENKMTPFLKERKVQLVNLTNGMHLLSSEESSCGESHHHEEQDRHVWLDPLLVIDQVQAISQTLSTLFPDHEATFQKNTETLVAQLEQLNQEVTEQLTPFQDSYLLISHPALGYYCARYGIHQLSIECEGKEPRPQQIAQIVQEAIDHDVAMVLTEPQYNNKGATLIAEKLQLPIYQIDPYSEHYFEMMHHITQLITQNYDH